MTLDEVIKLACLMEVTAKKPGNVHPLASFDDLRYDDFLKATNAIAEPLAAARDVGLGTSILNAVRASRNATGTNVNLGIVLLVAPLAAVPLDSSLETGIAQVLRQTTIEDAELVFEAIRLATPGGMGEVSSQDIRNRPTITLFEAMVLAADRDRIAQQYASGFSLVFEACNKLREFMDRPLGWEASVVLLHLWIMSKWPDTLIARKCGLPMAQQAAEMAAKVLNTCESKKTIVSEEFNLFDAWLRADGHRRNPGTTADLVAATLFAALRDGLIDECAIAEFQVAAKQYVAV